MPYKTFVNGEEALAADANTYLMSQTVARFPTAAARDAAITAPIKGQQCVLDTQPGEVLFYSGVGWGPLGWYFTRFLSIAPNVAIPAGGNNAFEFPALTIQRPMSMMCMVLCFIGPAAGSVNSTNISIQAVANSAGIGPTASPVSAMSIGTTGLPIMMYPMTAMWRNIPAGSNAALKVRFDVGPTGGVILNVGAIHGIVHMYSPGQEV